MTSQFLLLLCLSLLVMLVYARVGRNKLTNQIAFQAKLTRLLSAEVVGLRAVIRDIEKENAALVEDCENAVLALTECQGHVNEAQAARLDFLVQSFVDRRQDETNLQDEIDAMTRVDKLRNGGAC